MFSSNLLYLRKSKQISQLQLAEDLQLPRTTLGDYERGKTEPNIATLVKLSQYFKIDLDNLLKKDLSKGKLKITNTRSFKVLAITVDRNNKENIELVRSKAEAGYLQSFSDPEYIKDLPKLYFPDLPEGSFRAFQIHGDSMLPLESGSIIVCSYVEKISDIKSESTYVVVSKKEGLVYKRIKTLPKEKKILAVSDNPSFVPYKVDFADIEELWKYHAHISFSDKKKSDQNLLDNRLHDIQQRLRSIEKKL